MNTNKQTFGNNKKQILLKCFHILFMLEFFSVFMVVLFVFPSDNVHLFGRLFGSLITLILVTNFLFRIFFPLEVSKEHSVQRKHASVHFSKSISSIQRPHYDALRDTTNPASPSYYGRFNRRV